MRPGFWLICDQNPGLIASTAIIARLAGLQHGAVARWQLLRRGLTDAEIRSRIARGSLRPVHQGVYLVGPTNAPFALEAAAALAFNPPAVVSHRSAARLHRILPFSPSADRWVTTPRGDSRRPGLVVRGGVLDPRDVTAVERIPVTTAARAILDCAPIVEDEQLEAMCAEAHALGLAKAPALREQLERNPGRRGTARLRKLLDRPAPPRRTKRELERRLLRLVLSSSLPDPETNVWVGPKNVDMLWRAERVVVEGDSYTFHSHARPWARDIGKSNELQLQGYLVLRFTWFDVTERPAWVIDKIARALVVRTA